MVVRSLTVAALVATTACYSIRPVLNAREFIQAKQPQRVWVVNNANESYVLNTPRVEGDNIVGLRLNSGDEVTIPLGQAQLVEAKQRDKKKTLVAGLVLGAVVGGVVYFAATAGNDNVVPGGYEGEGSRVR
jgi:cytochrome c-type biogenesis protein CcmH/NrfG